MQYIYINILTTNTIASCTLCRSLSGFGLTRNRCSGATPCLFGSRCVRLVCSVFGFLSHPGIPGLRSMGPSVSNSLTHTPCWNLNDLTVADEDSNSILTDNAKAKAKAMWQCKWHNLVANFGTNASDVIWWPNFEPSGVLAGGQMWN